jgi:small subunit ribosomal protein S6
MRHYETVFIVKSNTGEDEITAVIEKVSSIVTADGGTVFTVDKWGLKKLAYLIRKETQGYYIYIDYAAVPTAVAEIERIFKIDDRLLKYMTLKLADACDPATVLEDIAKGKAEAAEQHSESEDLEEEGEEDEDAEESGEFAVVGND